MTRDPLHGDDYVFDRTDVESLPGFVRRVALDLTYDEAHAAELGAVGLLLGAALSLGHDRLALGTLVALITVAFGLRAAPNSAPVARRIVRKEPWYFTTVLLVTTALGAGGVAVAIALSHLL
jgi:hypothetical protein